MAVRAFTDQPQDLLLAVKKSINAGRITRWRIDEDGDLTLSNENFTNQAWMRPSVLKDRLLFNIIGNSNYEMTTRLYAIFHARLVEMLLSHFDSKIKTVSATAMPTPGDIIPD